MKKAIALAITAAVSAALLSGCTINIKGMSASNYDHAERYIMGGAQLSERIEGLSIQWPSGGVKIATHEKDTVSFSETASVTLDEDTSLYYCLDEGELTIQYARSGAKLPVNMNKELTVYLPQDLELEDLELKLVSAIGEVEGVSVQELEVGSVSGDVYLQECQVESGRAHTVSGRVDAQLVGDVQTLEMGSVSGALKVEAVNVEEFDADTTSGDVELRVDEAPEYVDVGTVSGRVELDLPENDGFTLKVKTTSGSVKSDFETKADGKNYTYGNGEREYDVSTTSGNIFIGKHETNE